jgi:hypothetical protein
MKLQEAALINTSVGPAGSNQLQAKEAADAPAPPPWVPRHTTDCTQP